MLDLMQDAAFCAEHPAILILDPVALLRAWIRHRRRSNRHRARGPSVRHSAVAR